jgi:hypothetical protein
MLDVFNRIYDLRAMSAIERLALEAIEDGAVGRDLQYLNAILESNDLDEIYVLALLGAGRVDEADALQREIDGFKARRALRQNSQA